MRLAIVLLALSALARGPEIGADPPTWRPDRPTEKELSDTRAAAARVLPLAPAYVATMERKPNGEMVRTFFPITNPGWVFPDGTCDDDNQCQKEVDRQCRKYNTTAKPDEAEIVTRLDGGKECLGPCDDGRWVLVSCGVVR